MILMNTKITFQEKISRNSIRNFPDYFLNNDISHQNVRKHEMKHIFKLGYLLFNVSVHTLYIRLLQIQIQLRVQISHCIKPSMHSFNILTLRYGEDQFSPPLILTNYFPKIHLNIILPSPS